MRKTVVVLLLVAGLLGGGVACSTSPSGQSTTNYSMLGADLTFALTAVLATLVCSAVGGCFTQFSSGWG
jgi:hypothetical protein